MQPVEQKIWQMLEPGVEDLELRLVRVRYSGTEGRGTLQIMIEPQEATAQNRVSVTVEQCEKVSRMASALMDVEDPISAAYNLEVSSTGLERPLVTLADFTDYAGFEVKLETTDPVDERKRFRGVLNGTDGTDILFTVEQGGGDYRIPHDLIKTARILDDKPAVAQA